MDNEEKFLGLVGTASERAGAFAGKVATIGDKIAGLASDGVSTGKKMLGLADKKQKLDVEKKPDSTKDSPLKSGPAGAQQKPSKAEKKQSKFESQLKELKTENHSLVSQLDQMRSKLSEVRSRESTVRARAVALESELDDTRSQLEEAQSKSGKRTTVETGRSKLAAELKSELSAIQRELEETQKKAHKTQSDFASQFKALQVENKSLSSDLERTQSKANQVQVKLKSQISNLQSENKSLKSKVKELQSEDNETLASEKYLKKQIIGLETKLATAQEDLAKTKKQVKRTQTKFKKQIRDIQEEKKSLAFDLKQAQKEANDERIRADSMESQIAALESNVTAFGLTLREAREKKSNIDVVPAIKDIKPSIEVTAVQEESVDISVENVEEPKPESAFEPEDKMHVEEVESEPLPEIKVREAIEVTVEDVQAADFTSETDRIIFMRALSDFASSDTAARVGAARAIACINHKLSVRVLIAHLADEPSAVIRQECIKALTTLEMAEGLSVVENALTDKTASVRLAAVWGIYRLAGVESVTKLMVMLSDDAEEVRRRVVTCIGWLGGQLDTIGNSHFRKVVSSLIECLDDSAESVRKAALDALEAVTGKQMAEPVLASQNSLKYLTEQWRNWWKVELSRQK